MNNFAYARAESAEGAISLLSQNANSKFLGGGPNLVDLMREDIEQPDALIDVTGLPSADITGNLVSGKTEVTLSGYPFG